MKKRLLSINDMPIERMKLLKRVEFSFRTIGKGIMVFDRHKGYSSRTLEQNARKFAEGNNSAVPLILYTWHPSQKTEVFDLASRERNPSRKSIHSAKFDRCVQSVKRSGSPVNPYAVCSSAIGEEGSVRKGHRRRNPYEPGKSTKVTRTEATQYLKERYREQAEKFPLLRDSVSESLYVKRNLPYVLRNARERARGSNPLPSIRKVYYIICAHKGAENYYLARSGKLTRSQSSAARFSTAQAAIDKAKQHLKNYAASRKYRFDLKFAY